MVYECPQCKTALSPGSAACPNCGLKFETPTPADATLPPPAPTVPGPTPLPYAAPPPSYASALPGADSLPLSPTANPARKAAVSIAGLIALCVLLVVLAIFAVKTFFQQETASNPPVSAPPMASPLLHGPASGMTIPPRTATLSSSNLPPVTLSPGTAAATSTGGADSNTLVGRWQTKNADYYVFSGGGSGAYGNQSDGRKETPFRWILADNQLILNGAKEEHLTYSNGPDANTMYLRSAKGQYRAFTRAANQ